MGAVAVTRKSQGLTRVNVMLDPGTIKAAQDIGFGNLSAGLREAVRRAGEAQMTTPERVKGRLRERAKKLI